MTEIAPSAQLASPSVRVATLDEAYRTCLDLCRSHYENFPVASLLMTGARRRAVAAVYAFARIADDFADEPGWKPEERLRLLEDWRGRLRNSRRDHGRHPVFWALADAIDRFELPLDQFERLLDAFETDVRQNRFQTFQDVLRYCACSANPIGHLVLRIHGEWSPQRGRWSDAICTALQLSNFWQDLKIDGSRGRLYVPLEDVQRSGLSEHYVMEGGGPLSSRQELLSQQTERTWAFFREGRPLCEDVSAALRMEMRLVWLGGTGILRKIEAQNHDVWKSRPVMSLSDWLACLPRAIFWKRTA